MPEGIGVMPALDPRSIAASGLCTGCGACVIAAPRQIRMQMDSIGFLRPTVEGSLTDAAMEAVGVVCPGISLSHSVPSVDTGLWGPIAKAAAGYSSDSEIRFHGSSGGVVSGLAAFLLDSGEVDFVVHTCPSDSAPLKNMVRFSRTREDVLSGSGSRYSPAAPAAALAGALAEPGRFAFVGKPCDVAAVRKWLTANPAMEPRIPYLLSFMCAGTPSQVGTDAVLNRLGMAPEAVGSFRYRGRGWPGMTRAVSTAGQSVEMDYNTAWGQILNRHLPSRCKLCADGTGEFADVIGADAWYSGDGYPDFSEREGRSLVLARTAKGAALFDRAVAARALIVEDFDLASLPGIQPYQSRRKSLLRARIMALRVLGRPVPDYRNMGLEALSRQAGWRANLREFVGAFHRAIRGRL